MIKRINIILLILVALAGPASAATVVYSLVSYFGNISDQPEPFPKNDNASTLDGTKCAKLQTKYRDGSTAETIINAASKHTGVEAAQIAAQIEIESGFNQDAMSDGGGGDKIAYGLMQTIPPTYNENKRKDDPAVSYQTIPKTDNKGRAYDAYRINPPNLILENPQAAVMAGSKYYRRLLDEFKDPDIAVAAYNAGPGYIRKTGWKKGKPRPELYEETTKHIERFNTALATYRACTGKKEITGKRIYLHWTGGAYNVTSGKYTYNIFKDGKAVKTNNTGHTLGRNTDSIGISITAMDGCGDSSQYNDLLASSYKACTTKPTKEQIDGMVLKAAEVAVANDIPIDQDHVMSHAEAGSLMDFPATTVAEAMKQCGNADSETTDSCFQSFGLPTNNYGPYRGGNGTRWEFKGFENQLRSMIQAKVNQLK